MPNCHFYNVEDAYYISLECMTFYSYNKVSFGFNIHKHIVLEYSTKVVLHLQFHIFLFSYNAEIIAFSCSGEIWHQKIQFS